MNATFYTLSKRENSTARPTGTGQAYTILLKDDCSLISPRIALELSPPSNPTAYNYCYLPDFNRYYFVRDWSYFRGLWTATLSVDVLATYKEEIGLATEYVARSSDEYDGDIVDNLYPMTGEISVSRTDFTGSIWSKAGDSPLTDGFYVVGVIGNYSSTGGGNTSGISYYLMEPAVFNDFMNALYSDAYVQTVSTTITTSANEILTAINPLSYIASMRWFPLDSTDLNIDLTYQMFKIPVGWGYVELGLGHWAHPLYDNFAEFTQTLTLPAHPQAASRGNYLNKGQFTHRSLFYPPFGVINLDADKVAYSDSVELVFRLDFRSGDCYLTIYSVKSSSRNSVIAFVSAQGSSDVMRAGITNNEWSTYEDVQHGLEFGAATAHRAAGVLNTWDITKPASAVATGLETAGAIADTAADAMQLQGQRARAQFPVLSTRGTDGAIAAFAGSPFVCSIFQIAVEDDNAQRGRPLCQKRQLSTLPGYIVVADPDLAIAGTAEENVAVKAYMSAGFFYE